ncbi:MAG: hypothetical protein PWQ59_437 [Thermoanaerobacterium sp.]|nr:hypothetical protein [Thermoanaerobacterium sp.]
MYDALVKQLGVVTAAAKQAEIDRTTHYKWLREDENYKAWVEEIPDIVIDFAENALFRQIQEGNTTSIIFFLKTKGKERGYVEKQEIAVSGEVDNTLTVESFRQAWEQAKKKQKKE